MKIIFEKEYLEQIFYFGQAKGKKYRFPESICRRYVKVVKILSYIEKHEDFARHRGLYYKRLKGDRKNIESVRINDKYRLEFTTQTNDSGEKRIVICSLLDISNHYKK